MMSDKDNKNIENTGEESFADMLEKTFTNSRFEPGQKVEAEIVKISGDYIFLNLGGKSEGYIEKKEITDTDGKLKFKEGEKVSAYFVSAQNGEMRFTTKISGAASAGLLRQAFENKIPVEGFVEKEIKGGYEIKIAGNVKAFCPYSQMGIERTKDGSIYVRQHLMFMISEYSEKGRNIILSNREILEQEKKVKADALKQSLKEGDKVKGVIKSIQNFGAFVDIGGVQALLPVSEISWARVENINEVLQVGQEIEAVLAKTDWANNKISLSLKDMSADPWSNAAQKYQTGKRLSGKVSRLTNFGAFVTLEPGIDGLIHISDLGDGVRIKHPRDVVTEGQTIEVQVNSVDSEKKKISLSAISTKKEEEALEIKNFLKDSQNTSDSYKALGNLSKFLKKE